MGRHKKDAMVDVSHRRCYEALAEHAAVQCGLPATAQAAAENDQAREIRDCLWAELQKRIGDLQTYAIDGIFNWLNNDIGVSVGRGSVQRLREQHVAGLAAIRLRAERARQVIEAVGKGGEGDALEAGRAISAQIMFNALAGLDDTALANLKPAQIINMINSVALLSRQDIETRYRTAQLGELVKKFDRELAAKVRGPNGVLNAADLAEIRKAVFGTD
jgi:hypothetical protein